MNNRIILTVKQPGIIFKLDGKKFRTPFTLDVTNLKIDNIIRQLQSYGIINYDISTIKKKSDDNEKKIEKTIILENNNGEIDNLVKKVNELEKTIEKLSKQCEDNKKDREQNIEIHTGTTTDTVIDNEVTKKINRDQSVKKKVVIEELIVDSDEKLNKDFKLNEIEEHFNSLQCIEKLSKIKK